MIATEFLLLEPAAENSRRGRCLPPPAPGESIDLEEPRLESELRLEREPFSAWYLNAISVGVNRAICVETLNRSFLAVMNERL